MSDLLVAHSARTFRCPFRIFDPGDDVDFRLSRNGAEFVSHSRVNAYGRAKRTGYAIGIVIVVTILIWMNGNL